MIRSHVLRRAQKGIHTKVIAPFLSIYTNKTLEKDKDRLVERRFISETELLPEGQVSIYGDKVALISYHSHDTIVTIIQDRAIASTFYSLFNYMWNNSEKFTEQAIKEMQNRLSVEHNL